MLYLKCERMPLITINPRIIDLYFLFIFYFFIDLSD